MLRSLACLTLFAAALSALTSRAMAQGFANRGVRDIRLVHPPGTPPGTWRIDVGCEFGADDQVVRPADFGCDLHVLLNGTEIEVISQPVTLESTLASCGLTCNGGCGGWYCFPNYYIGQCNLVTFHSGYQTCACSVRANTDGGSQSSDLRTTDVITVTVTPTSTGIADNDPGDDSLSLQLSDIPTGTTLCFGDGTQPTACPCGNSGASGQGCANSANTNGALLGATGWTGIDAASGTDNITLHGSGMPATATAIYLKSDGLDANGVVFGDGVLCLTGSLIRLRTKINVGGASQFPEPGDPSVSVRGATPPGSGLIGRYQVYYRNAAAGFCPPATFNISNGVELEW